MIKEKNIKLSSVKMKPWKDTFNRFVKLHI